MKTCKFEGPECSDDQRGFRQGMCGYHRYRARIGKLDEPKSVRFKGSPCIECGKPSVAVGRCEDHWKKYDASIKKKYIASKPKKGSDIEPCPVPGCKQNKRKRYAICVSHRKTAGRYSLEPWEYLEMVKDGICSICGREDARLIIDHDHSCCPAIPERHSLASCGACVRGAICRFCNNALGMAGDNPVTLRALAEYLENYSGVVRLR